MKIALPASGKSVDSHFGHCESFAIFSVDENNNIKEEEAITPPAGCGCKSNIIPTLKEMGVTVMLAGNMGQGAVNILNSVGIQVVRGCSGDVTDVVNRYVQGKITDSGEGCTEHGGHNCDHKP